MIDDETTHLRALLADEHAKRCAAELDHAGAVADLAEWKTRAEKVEAERAQALAACAEMRAALEAIDRECLGYKTWAFEARAAVEAGRAALSRTDLGRGWASPEVVARVRDVLHRLPRAGWGYTDAERAAVADLDALLKKGGG